MKRIKKFLSTICYYVLELGEFLGNILGWLLLFIVRFLGGIVVVLGLIYVSVVYPEDTEEAIGFDLRLIKRIHVLIKRIPVLIKRIYAFFEDVGYFLEGGWYLLKKYLPTKSI